MQSNSSKRRPALCGFAALCAALSAAAAGGSATAAPTETILHNFKTSDGDTPSSELYRDSKGNLYGTTAIGGASSQGVVFKLSPPVPPATKWTETVLYSFCPTPSCSGGANPVAGLIADTSGNLYGTAPVGGGSTNPGVVLKLAPPIPPATKWTETVLHTFCSLPECPDGLNPVAGLIADSKGNLYGTTSGGGASGNGVVFKLSPGGAYKVLHSFAGSPNDGGNPLATLIADSSGNLYGTTLLGGAHGGSGVVFKLAPDGTETVLYSFCSKPGCSDGSRPRAGLIADTSGILFGTTQLGGSPGGCGGSGCGVVFKLSPRGTYTVLHTFTGASDGSEPEAGLIADDAGNLYGTTNSGGGPFSLGVVFKLSPGGAETVLHTFCSHRGCSDGAQPVAGLIADSTGSLYGTTSSGGTSPGGPEGTVFELTGTGFVP